jgi:hypothetical protein
MTNLLRSLPNGDYFTYLAAVMTTATSGLWLYRQWLAACRDRRYTKRLHR